MLSFQKFTRAQLKAFKRAYSVKRPDSYFIFRDFENLCDDLNRLRSHDGGPDPRLSEEDAALRMWAEDVLTQLCPTQLQKAKERAGLTWKTRAATALENYYGYFGNWAHGRLEVRLIHPWGGVPRFSCTIEPGTNSVPFRGNRGLSARLPPNSVPATRENEMAVRLWNVFFLQEGYKLLKRCHYCERWFVDKGKNRKARFCSPSCTNRWWNKGRRLDSPNYGKRLNKTKQRKKARAS